MSIKVWEGTTEDGEWVVVGDGESGTNSTTILNYANNRVLTGSDTANTLNAETNLTYKNSTLIAPKVMGCANVEVETGGVSPDYDHIQLFMEGDKGLITYYEDPVVASGNAFEFPEGSIFTGWMTYVYNASSSEIDIGIQNDSTNVTALIAGTNESITGSDSFRVIKGGFVSINCIDNKQYVITGGIYKP